MLELFKAYSVEQILIFGVMLLFAIKSAADLAEWMYGKYTKKFNKDYSVLEKEEDAEERYNELKDQLDTLISEFRGFRQTVEDRTENIDSQLAQLTQSDMHDIKSWMVEKHHQLIEAGWVDDFTMDTIEKRFDDYKKENGNSYVEGLVNEIRALPHHPPKDM